MKLKQTMITAHSGCDGTPENSLDFVRYALSIGIDSFEVDVNIGNNGILYINHEQDPTGVYKGCTTLEEVMKLMLSSEFVKINCDLKSYNIENDVLKMAKYFKIIDRLIFSGSINLNFVRENRSLFETADIFLNVEKILREQIKLNSINNNQVEIIIFSKEIINTCRELNVNIVNINEKLCTDLFLEKMKMNGIGVSVWTVDDPDRIMFFLKKEIENITTRNAALAMKLKQGLINNGNKLC